MTRGSHVDLVLDHGRGGQNLLSEIVPRQNSQFVSGLNDRDNAGDRSNDDSVARRNG